MDTQVRKLKEKLFGENGIGCTSIHITPGSAPATAEQLAAAINKSIADIEAGNFDAPSDETDD